jgi:uncharacterized protein
MKRIVVFYHSDCPDGFSAVWAAWKKFGARAEYHAIEPRKLPDGILLKNRDIYILDNSLSPDTVTRLERSRNRVVVIDHHESSRRDVERGTRFVFDLKHSGAVLAWRFFHPGRPVPELLRYIEDGDLWRFHLPHADLLLSYIYTRPFGFAEWSALAGEFEAPRGRARALKLGKVINEYDRVLTDEIAAKADLVRFAGHAVLAVNSSLKRLGSEVGHALVTKRPPIGIVWYEAGGICHVSLRSNRTVDVSKLARRFGGGGHPRAAGFSVRSVKALPWKILNERV